MWLGVILFNGVLEMAAASFVLPNMDIS